jgi:hypothetical protein
LPPAKMPMSLRWLRWTMSRPISSVI